MVQSGCIQIFVKCAFSCSCGGHASRAQRRTSTSRTAPGGGAGPCCPRGALSFQHDSSRLHGPKSAAGRSPVSEDLRPSSFRGPGVVRFCLRCWSTNIHSSSLMAPTSINTRKAISSQDRSVLEHKQQRRYRTTLSHIHSGQRHLFRLPADSLRVATERPETFRMAIGLLFLASDGIMNRSCYSFLVFILKRSRNVAPTSQCSLTTQNAWG